MRPRRDVFISGLDRDVKASLDVLVIAVVIIIFHVHWPLLLVCYDFVATINSDSDG